MNEFSLLENNKNTAPEVKLISPFEIEEPLDQTKFESDIKGLDIIAVAVETSPRPSSPDQMLIENQNDEINIKGTSAGLFIKGPGLEEPKDEVLAIDYDSNDEKIISSLKRSFKELKSEGNPINLGLDLSRPVDAYNDKNRAGTSGAIIDTCSDDGVPFNHTARTGHSG